MKTVFCVIVVSLLCALFYWGGRSDGLQQSLIHTHLTKDVIHKYHISYWWSGDSSQGWGDNIAYMASLTEPNLEATRRSICASNGFRQAIIVNIQPLEN